MDAERQLEELLRLANSVAPSWLLHAVLLLALGAALGAAWTRHPFWLALCVFLAALAWGIRDTVPHLQRAAQAATRGVQREGRVRIKVTQWTESRTYEAEAVEGTQAWRFEFVPVNWRPHAGEFAARLYWLPDAEGPALVCTEAGLLVPQRQPRRVHP